MAGLVALLAAAPAAADLVRGTSAQGVAFVDGGIGRAEVEALQAERARYSLRVLTAARGSGAYLAGVRLQIRDARGQVVLAREMEGPWLLADLPEGRYEIAAVFGWQTRSAAVALHAGEHRQVDLYFDVPDDAQHGAAAAGAAR